jgi:hypothetical protein
VIGAINYPNNVTSTLSTAGQSAHRLRLLHHRPRPRRLRPDHRHRRLPGRLDALRRERRSRGAILALSGVAPPQLTKAPQISGHASVGVRLLASHGSWTGRPNGYRYQWLRCNAHGRSCIRIRNATHARHRVVHRDSGHRLRIRVTAVNAGGSRRAISRPTAHVPCLALLPHRNAIRSFYAGDLCVIVKRARVVRGRVLVAQRGGVELTAAQRRALLVLASECGAS